VAQYIFDPSARTTGLDPIASGEWVYRATSQTDRTWASSEIIELAHPFGEKVWRLQSGLSLGHIHLQWTESPLAGTVEILQCVKRDDDDLGVGNLVRISAAPGNMTGYFLGFRNNLTDIRGRKWSPARSNFGEESHGFTDPLNQFFWVYSRSIGTVHELKVWPVGVAVPSTFGMRESDADFLSGYCGLGDFAIGGGVTKEIAWFSIGTDGDPAPLPWEDSDFHKPSRTPFFLYGIPDTDILLPPTNLNFSNIQQNSMRLNWTAPS
jgi:hypothetical protein